MRVLTPAVRRTVHSVCPAVLIGSSSSMRRLSTSTPCWALSAWGDLVVGDGAVELAALAAARRDLDHLALKGAGLFLGVGQAHSFAVLFGAAGALHSVERLRRGLARQFARQKEVARVTVGNLHDLILLARTLDVLKQDYLHSRFSFLSIARAVLARIVAIVKIVAVATLSRQKARRHAVWWGQTAPKPCRNTQHLAKKPAAKTRSARRARRSAAPRRPGGAPEKRRPARERPTSSGTARPRTRSAPARPAKPP